jgi:hypothetical protein
MIYFSYFVRDHRIINGPIFMDAAREKGSSCVSYVTTCLEWRGATSGILLQNFLIF